MSDERRYNLAIETSGPTGSVTLGEGDRVLGEARLSGITSGGERRVDLMATIDALGRAHGVTPNVLGEAYVSIGPGSFTGLRIAVTTAKMLAQILGVKLVAVATLDAVAQNAPPSDGALAVCLNMKGPTVWSAIYTRDGERWSATGDAALRTMAELLTDALRPIALLGDPLPDVENPEGVTVLPAELAQPRSGVVWRLGRELAAKGQFTDPLKLAPIYARPPEAVELWKKNEAARLRKGKR